MRYPFQPAAIRKGDRPGVDYLRISVTDRCNFRCSYCMPREGVDYKSHDDILSYEQIIRFAGAASKLGIKRVRVTGGEPLVRRQCADLIASLAQIKGIEDLSLSTNGSLLDRHAGELKLAGLGRVNISIDSLDARRYARVTGGGRLSLALSGVKKALAAGLSPVKINVVMLTGIEKELPAFISLMRELPVHVRFIELMPIGRQAGAAGRATRQDLLGEFKRYVVLKPALSPQGGGPATYYGFAGATGKVGFISLSEHFCHGCNRLRLTADGRLRSCLFSEEEIDIRPFIDRDRQGLMAAIFDGIREKRYDWRLAGAGPRTMSQIGG